MSINTSPAAWQQIDFDTAKRALALPDTSVDSIQAHWDQSMSAAPNGIPGFLLPAQYTHARNTCSMDACIDNALHRATEKILANPALTALCWHAYHQNYTHNQCSFGTWPRFDHLLGEALAGMPYLLVALGHVPMTLAQHKAMGIPENITRDTCLEVNGFCQNHQLAHHGHPGLLQQQLQWVGLYPQAKLFRLGRMEYKLHQYNSGFEAYRHRESNRKILLAPHDLLCDQDGYVMQNHDKQNTWRTQLQRQDTAILGHPVCPTGHIKRDIIVIQKDQWECVLKNGDCVIDAHIPPGGGLNIEACKDSFQQAVQFFAEYFPDQTILAINCQSWIFNPDFDTELPDSNLAKLQRQLYLYPIAHSGREGLFFVFMQDETFDPATAPRQTALQRYMIQTITSGKPLRASGMLLFIEDLPNFGQAYYRQHG